MLTDTQKVSCLFVHGWGMNRTVWQPVIERLPPWIDAHSIDLPGHGQRADESFSNLSSLAHDVKAHCASIKKKRQPLVLVGWSLGGLACLQMAVEQCGDVDALILVSCNPCFVTRENWQYGIKGAVFEQFGESLKKDFSATIRRFLSLQVKGSESSREILRDLREKILQQRQPDESSLEAGLSILQQTDLRDQLKKIKQPVNWLLGGQDGLVKAELAKTLTQVTVFEKAGHAPFLSHTDLFVERLVKIVMAKSYLINRDLCTKHE